MRRRTGTVAMCAMATSLAVCTLGARSHAQEIPSPDLNPIVFVHGGSGSGAQFQSQALRFASNGYPQNFIRVLEYDSSAIQRILPDVLVRLDALIAELQLQTGRPQVDLVGHSLGTVVSQSYLSSPERAEQVAHYVNVDGRTAAAPPGGVPTLALFAGAARAVQGQIVGATNVTLADQEHIEAVTSAEAFVEMFRFFTGRDPATSNIVPEAGPFPVSGRAVIFPQNVGVGEDALVLVWEIDPTTGQRLKNFFGLFAFPLAVSSVVADGSFGQFPAFPGAQYELTLVRAGAPAHRFFFEPFLRSDALVRLNTGMPGQGLDAAVERNPAHSALVITRNKEFRGDRDASSNDVLAVNGLDVINEVTAPSGFVGGPAALFLFDLGSDRISNVRSVPPPFGMIGFLRGADVFLPADPPGTITIQSVPRGDATARTLRIPNPRSTDERVTVQLNDFEETLGSIQQALFVQACSADPVCTAAILAALQQQGS
jgi:pimeloyl-ACP methyl ester carboxylesterase